MGLPLTNARLLLVTEDIIAYGLEEKSTVFARTKTRQRLAKNPYTAFVAATGGKGHYGKGDTTVSLTLLPHSHCCLPGTVAHCETPIFKVYPGKAQEVSFCSSIYVGIVGGGQVDFACTRLVVRHSLKFGNNWNTKSSERARRPIRLPIELSASDSFKQSR